MPAAIYRKQKFKQYLNNNSGAIWKRTNQIRETELPCTNMISVITIYLYHTMLQLFYYSGGWSQKIEIQDSTANIDFVRWAQKIPLINRGWGIPTQQLGTSTGRYPIRTRLPRSTGNHRGLNSGLISMKTSSVQSVLYCIAEGGWDRRTVKLECVAKQYIYICSRSNRILIDFTFMHQLNLKLNLKGYNIDLSRITSPVSGNRPYIIMLSMFF